MNTKIQELASQERAAKDAMLAIENKYKELKEEIRKDFHEKYPEYYISDFHSYSYINSFCVQRCSDDKIMDNFGSIRYYNGDKHYYYDFEIKEE